MIAARVECDRCENVATLSSDDYDLLADTWPGLEYAPGAFILRCTAWPDRFTR